MSGFNTNYQHIQKAANFDPQTEVKLVNTSSPRNNRDDGINTGIKTVIINMHKDLKEDMNIKKTEVEDIFKNRISLTENIISEMENLFDGQVKHCSR